MVHLVVLVACVFRATTKKGHQFLRKKVHPRENPDYAYEYVHPWEKYCGHLCVQHSYYPLVHLLLFLTVLLLSPQKINSVFPWLLLLLFYVRSYISSVLCLQACHWIWNLSVLMSWNSTSCIYLSLHEHNGFYANHVYIFHCIISFLSDFSVNLTLLHGMQTWSNYKNSVWLSVCPSVWLTRELWQKGRKISPDFYTIRKNVYGSLTFWWKERLVGHPFYLKFWVNRPLLERNRRFWSDICSYRLRRNV